MQLPFHPTAWMPMIVLSLGLTLSSEAAEPAAEGMEGTLRTRWADDVDPNCPWPEYPRPQMVRSDWVNLNGPWQYAIRPRGDAAPPSFDGQILVPFPVESQLSGVRRQVGESNVLWYRREFADPRPGGQGRLLLHFGAVDWETTVWINGEHVGDHRGGHDAFSFDISQAARTDGTNELLVRVWDPTDAASYPRGKQQRQPEGIWYTPVTGIWQTAWLEPVPSTYIRRVETQPDFDTGTVKIELDIAGDNRGVARAIARAAGTVVARAEETGTSLSLTLTEPRHWSPEDPFLYDLSIELASGDRVESYFGLRKIEVRQTQDGHRRLFLNGQPRFQYGTLDQGWWPDGLYTAPTAEALRFDIEVTRELGFNTIRKHVKVEPALWYYYCDALGMLVWQDMPSAMRDPRGPEHVAPTAERDFARDEESAAQFEAELRAMIDGLRHSPSIVMWVPFNEGWGQYDTERIAAWTKQYDPTRLVNCPSGWTDRGVGDVLDVHHYPGPTLESPGEPRAAVLGEFGGLGWPVPDHLWWNRRNWGYRTYDSQEKLSSAYDELLRSLVGLLGRGLAAAVYTQTTDVEGEVNGLMTYDRAVLKFDPSQMSELARPLYGAVPTVVEYLPTSQEERQGWRVSRSEPPSNWTAADFDHRDWRPESGPFVEGNLPFLQSGTPWSGETLWLRKTFEVDRTSDAYYLQTYYAAAKVAIYINGRLVRELNEAPPTRRHFQHLAIDSDLAAIRPGKNVIAVHVVQPQRPRAFDVGLYGARSNSHVD